ncbi:CBS domain-containing protein [Qipengyuania sp. DGS5-3]|uniref:CBS domain-containing protein n=1 Tax=Qipengyuania sp. DGS5-3 TaxID=3349632 RepID=UPI0036D2CDEF
MTIAKIIANRSSSDIIACDVNTPVREAVSILAGKRIGALPVLDGGTVAGILSERDVIYRMAEEGATCLDKRVGEIMTSPAVTVEPSTKIDDALGLMTRRRFRHFPVIDNGALCAFISIGDLVKSKIDEVEHEAEALRTYIQT